MNAPVIPRAILRHHVATVEARFPLRILGQLPAGAAAHVPDGLSFLAEKREGLNLLGLCDAEVTLSDLLGQPVGIVLISGLRGREAEEFPQQVQPV